MSAPNNMATAHAFGEAVNNGDLDAFDQLGSADQLGMLGQLGIEAP